MHGRQETFFQGRAKFSRGGKNIQFALKMPRNIPFSFKEVEKHTILAGKGGGGQVPPNAFPCGRPWVFDFTDQKFMYSVQD